MIEILKIMASLRKGFLHKSLHAYIHNQNKEIPRYVRLKEKIYQKSVKQKRKSKVENIKEWIVFGFLAFFCLIFILSPLAILAISDTEINEKVHECITCTAFSFAFFGAAILCVESIYDDLFIVRQILHLTGENKKPEVFESFLKVSTSSFLYAIIVASIAANNKHTYQDKLFISIVIIIMSVWGLLTFIFTTWYSMVLEVNRCIHAETSESQQDSFYKNNDEKAINISRKWFKRVGFYFLSLSAIFGIVDCLKNSFNVKL